MSGQSPLLSVGAALETTDVRLESFAAVDDLPPRQCGRCRLTFPGDPDLFPGTIPDWWLCPPCRSILLGDGPKAGLNQR